MTNVASIVAVRAGARSGKTPQLPVLYLGRMGTVFPVIQTQKIVPSVTIYGDDSSPSSVEKGCLSMGTGSPSSLESQNPDNSNSRKSRARAQDDAAASNPLALDHPRRVGEHRRPVAGEGRGVRLRGGGGRAAASSERERMAAVTSSEKWCGGCRCLCPDRGRAAAALSREGQDGCRLA